jgi:membrane protein
MTPRTIWTLAKRTAEAFIEDAALTRGAAIAFYAITSLGPVLLVVVAIAAVSGMLNRHLPFAALLLEAANFLITLVLLSAVIATIFKVLPDRDLAWRDVAVGAMVTALLLTLGKVALGIYIGSSATISSYGAAGSVVATLFWIFYSAQIFLLGAEFTQVYATYGATLSRSPGGSARPSDRASAAPGRPSPRAG